MRESGSYALLLAKLEAFRRKYHLNQLIRGVLFTTAALLGGYLLVSLLEYRFYFPPAVRQVLFFGGIAASLALLIVWVVLPLLRYFRLSRSLDDVEAARLIGSHFSEVEDRLLNILQLRRQADDQADNSLIEASINQKIEAIRPVPFSLAIDLGKNRRYLPYALPPLMALVFLLFAAPNVLRESNTRLLRNGEHFEREAPFRFVVESEPLEAVQFQDYVMRVRVEGEALPDQVWIHLAGQGAASGQRLQKLGPDSYAHTFPKVAGDLTFYLEAAGFRSRPYTLQALPYPGLDQLELRLDYPAYTGKADEVLRNRGDATVPQGTELSWVLRTSHTEQVGFRFADGLHPAERRGQGEFQYSRRADRDEAYKIGLGNERVANRDSLAFRITVIPDRHPAVAAEQFRDSSSHTMLYFLGEISDDYGLRNLNFRWTRESSNQLGERETLDEGTERVGFSAGQRSAFHFNWDLSRQGLGPGERVVYYFEVWDNDAINGSKSARTAAMTYEMPTLEAFEAQTEANNNQIKDQLEQALREIDQTQREVERLREKMMQEKELSWQDRKQLENLLDKQQQIQQRVEDIQETFRQNLSQQSDYKQYDEQLLRKQEQLQQLFEEVVSDELKELFEEMEKLLEELSREQGLEELEEMQLTDQQLENELDRMLELFKQLELEQKMEDLVNKLEELSQQQEELAQQAAEQQSSPEDLAEQQQKLNEQFDKLQEELDKLSELNQDLSQPHEMPDTSPSEEMIEQGMQESLEQMQQSSGSQQQGKQKQSQQQKQQGAGQMEENAEMLEELAQQLQSALSDMQQEQMAEDMESLEQLLDNLIRLSLDQEALLEELGSVQVNNPRYTELVQQQFKIREDSRMLEDSLIALSKRVFEISSFITRELADMNRYMGLSLEKLSDRKLQEARADQQFSMTSMNNLALMLSEVMDQMMESMANQMPGSQMCQKPGKGKKPSNSQMKEMGDLQNELNRQMQQLKEGQKPGQRNPLQAQQFARMAAKQAAIRQALQEMGQQMQGTQEQGDLAKELRQIAEEMEKTEEDLVNKVFNEEMLMRQQEILTRMLEAEDAIRQREMDPQRKSQTASEPERALPPSLEEYLKKRQAEIDLFKTVPANLKPYYRDLVEDYLKGLDF